MPGRLATGDGPVEGTISSEVTIAFKQAAAISVLITVCESEA